MGNFSRSKVLKLAKGFKGRSNSCYSIAIRKVHKALQYQYRDRRVKKRLMRRDWIETLSAASREHGFNYSRFIMCLNRSNVCLDRKILADLAINEPYSFKAVVDEVKRQNDFAEFDYENTNRRLKSQRDLTLAEAIATGKLRVGGPPTAEELAEMEKALIPEPLDFMGLRFPERDAKTDADYMRMSFVEEDEAFLAD